MNSGYKSQIKTMIEKIKYFNQIKNKLVLLDFISLISNLLNKRYSRYIIRGKKYFLKLRIPTIQLKIRSNKIQMTHFYYQGQELQN